VETPEGKAKKQSGPAMACDWNNISVMASWTVKQYNECKYGLFSILAFRNYSKRSRKQKE
jgi:hypothetical protein